MPAISDEQSRSGVGIPIACIGRSGFDTNNNENNGMKTDIEKLAVTQRGNLYWIIQALRPNIEIRITTDWKPIYRMRRFLRKANCEICGRRFREIEEGSISKRETLCGNHCMMTTREIEEHRGKEQP